MKEALYYEIEKEKSVLCLLCPQGCRLEDGKTGVCGVRENADGVLYSLVYERPVAIHIDPIEKKPLYHFHPGVRILSIGTYGCNLSCPFCQNYDLSQQDDKKVLESVKEVNPQKIIDLCRQDNLKFVAFTYNEPTIFYEYMLETAKLCKANDIKTVVVSNGQINEKPLRNLIKYIDAFNIDLKAFNPDFYKKICKGDIETTKNTIRIIIEQKKHLEVTFLLIEEYNDDENEFREYCLFLKNLDENIVLHISRAFPRFKLDFDPTPAGLLKRFEKIAGEYLRFVYLGNI
ncbi:MAG TPA: AmmeMemoRadiSam system radical SAM enzyme [Ignavibacteria bacterium]